MANVGSGRRRPRDDRRISFRGINAAIKDRECRVLAPLKRRLAPAPRTLRRPRCNLRRDYDVRLRNPVGATARSYGELLSVGRKIRAPRHIDSGWAIVSHAGDGNYSDTDYRILSPRHANLIARPGRDISYARRKLLPND